MAGVAVVTGANRGIGREVARQLAARGWTVVAGARDLAAGEAAAAGMAGEVLARRIDVTDGTTLAAVAAEVGDRYGRLDALVNNAAIHYDTWQRAAEADLDVVAEALATNLVGAWRAVEAFLPRLRAGGHGRIVNVSSGAGSLATLDGSVPAYSLSKLGLNGLTRMLAVELARDGILVNSVCPGWVATDMGGPGGRPVAEGAAGIVWAVELPDGGPTGGFFRDRQPAEW